MSCPIWALLFAILKMSDLNSVERTSANQWSPAYSKWKLFQINSEIVSGQNRFRLRCERKMKIAANLLLRSLIARPNPPVHIKYSCRMIVIIIKLDLPPKNNLCNTFLFLSVLKYIFLHLPLALSQPPSFCAGEMFSYSAAICHVIYSTSIRNVTISPVKFILSFSHSHSLMHDIVIIVQNLLQGTQGTCSSYSRHSTISCNVYRNTHNIKLYYVIVFIVQKCVDSPTHAEIEIGGDARPLSMSNGKPTKSTKKRAQPEALLFTAHLWRQSSVAVAASTTTDRPTDSQHFSIFHNFVIDSTPRSHREIKIIAQPETSVAARLSLADRFSSRIKCFADVIFFFYPKCDVTQLPENRWTTLISSSEKITNS